MSAELNVARETQITARLMGLGDSYELVAGEGYAETARRADDEALHDAGMVIVPAETLARLWAVVDAADAAVRTVGDDLYPTPVGQALGDVDLALNPLTDADRATRSEPRWQPGDPVYRQADETDWTDRRCTECGTAWSVPEVTACPACPSLTSEQQDLPSGVTFTGQPCLHCADADRATRPEPTP